MKLIDAVYEVLKDSDAPMGGEDIERVIRERGLYATKGKTLYASIGAAIYTDIKKRGAGSRFLKCGKGRFAVAGSAAANKQPELALTVGHSVPVPGSDFNADKKRQIQSGKKDERKKCHGAGYVYILTNKCLKGLVKIGKTSRTVDVRSKDLYNTAVPVPYDEYASLKTSKYAEVEELVHRILTKLTRKRVNENREFFRIKPAEALEILQDVATLLDPNDCKFNIPGRDEPAGSKLKRKALLSSGEKIFFCRGSGSDAKGKMVDGGFAVLRGSGISPSVTPTMEKHAPKMFNLRKQLERDGIIAGGVFKQQYVFTSPSAAACLIEGHNTSGNCDWRTADGVRLGQLKK